LVDRFLPPQSTKRDGREGNFRPRTNRLRVSSPERPSPSRYMRAGATERLMEQSHLSYLYAFGLIFAIGLAIYALTLSY
jgi:hypothetical protein